MRFFTGKGDQGESNLFDGRRISKGDKVLELIGTLDEATANLGLAISLCLVSEFKNDLYEVQDQLSKLMGYIAGVKKTGPEVNSFLTSTTEWLEKKIGYYGKSVDNPHTFVFSGKSTFGASVDIARTVIRRAERIAVIFFTINDWEGKEMLTYLNRLSSFLYVLYLYADSGINQEKFN